MACYTQDEIAEPIECERSVIDRVLREKESFLNSAKHEADHLTNFDVSFYNIFKQTKRSNALMCSGRWQRLRSFDYLAKVITGVKFRDDIEVTDDNQITA